MPFNFLKGNKGRTEVLKGPKIYVTPLGARYVKADELLRSERGREAVKKMADLALRRQRELESSEEQ